MARNTTLAREAAGIEVPAAGTWTIDAAHTTAGFVARHLMVAKVRGAFKEVSGAVVVADAPGDSTVEVTIGAASIDTGSEMRDGHLRSGDFLDVEHYPTLSYRSTRLEQTGATSFRMHGDLTIRDITRPVVLDVDYEGVVRDPYGQDKAAFTAIGEIDREDWGMTWNQVLETGGVVVGRKVRIELDVQLIRQR